MHVRLALTWRNCVMAQRPSLESVALTCLEVKRQGLASHVLHTSTSQRQHFSLTIRCLQWTPMLPSI